MRSAVFLLQRRRRPVRYVGACGEACTCSMYQLDNRVIIICRSNLFRGDCNARDRVMMDVQIKSYQHRPSPPPRRQLTCTARMSSVWLGKDPLRAS